MNHCGRLWEKFRKFGGVGCDDCVVLPVQRCIQYLGNAELVKSSSGLNEHRGKLIDIFQEEPSVLSMASGQRL